VIASPKSGDIRPCRDNAYVVFTSCVVSTSCDSPSSCGSTTSCDSQPSCDAAKIIYRIVL
ncbi:MAG: hypothetical protein J5603_02620, partial [Bacteroidales bacterium]|nr:hypothetical protein [Bacteroidales bacterium]